MALTSGANLGLLAHGAAGEEHYNELMRQWRGFDALIQCRILDKSLTAPPGAPADGDCYIVATGGTGAWAGKDGKIARWTTDLSPSQWEFITPRSGWRADVVSDSRQYRFTGAAWTRAENLQVFAVACSDETGALAAGANKAKFRIPYAFTLTDVRASLTTAQATNGAGGIFTVNVKKNGVTIFSTKITIDNTELTSKTAATLPVLSTTSLADDDEISVDLDQIGDGTAKGLKVYLIGRPT